MSIFSKNLNDQLDLEKDYELMSWAVPHVEKKENGNAFQLIFPIGTFIFEPALFSTLIK